MNENIAYSIKWASLISEIKDQNIFIFKDSHFFTIHFIQQNMMWCINMAIIYYNAVSCTFFYTLGINVFCNVSLFWSCHRISTIFFNKFRNDVSYIEYPPFIIIHFVTLTDKPGPPSQLRSKDVTEDSVTLAWAAPRQDGGSPVTGYIVEKREAMRMVWQTVGSTADTEFRVPRLTEGMNYVFRVSAENKLGPGQPEELTSSITAKSPHSEYPGAILYNTVDLLIFVGF